MDMQRQEVKEEEGMGKREVGQFEPPGFQPARLRHAKGKSLNTELVATDTTKAIKSKVPLSQHKQDMPQFSKYLEFRGRVHTELIGRGPLGPATEKADLVDRIKRWEWSIGSRSFLSGRERVLQAIRDQCKEDFLWPMHAATIVR